MRKMLKANLSQSTAKETHFVEWYTWVYLNTWKIRNLKVSSADFLGKERELSMKIKM